MSMVHLSQPKYKEYLDGLEPKKRKQYREKMRYWIKQKGYSVDEAHQVVTKSSSRKKNVVSLYPQRKKISASKPKVQKPVNWKITTESLLYFLLFCLSSALLISSSLKVFGFGWEGWAKAILIEAGIAFLFLSQSKSRWQKTAKTLTGLALVSLSFFVLHSSAKKEYQTEVSRSQKKNIHFSTLKTEIQQIDFALKNLPENFVSKRAELLDQLSVARQNLAIEMARQKSSYSAEVMSEISNVEIFFRGLLIVLNLYFCHCFLQKLSVILGQFEQNPAGAWAGV